MLRTVGGAVLKRALVGSDSGNGSGGDGAHYDVPAWSYIFLIVDIVLFVPLVFFVNYTVQNVFPVFAMVEDEKPPAYEPVALDDDFTEDAGQRTQNKPTTSDNKAVSSSIRAMSRLMRANGGFMAHFRGFFCLLAHDILTLALMGIFVGAFGGYLSPLATLLASLTLVQLSTAWVHIIITKRSELHFWSRLPPFKRTYEATWKATILYWAATEVTRWVPTALSALIGLEMPELEMGQPTRVPEVGGSTIGKTICVFGVTLACSIFVVIPARVIVHRVQASLLSPEEETIIPFDRTFDGKVEPAVVSGKGYATISDAWTTFSKAAWRRLVILYAKVFLVGFGAILAMGLISIPQGIIIAMFSNKVNDSTGDL
jgi:hypothetical protein